MIIGDASVPFVGAGRLAYAPVEDLGFRGFALVLDGRSRSGFTSADGAARRRRERDDTTGDQTHRIGVPGPTAWDMARAFGAVRADPLTFLGQVQRRYGDLALAFPVPGPPGPAAERPHDIRHVLQSNARHWGKRTVQYAALARVTGPGLLALRRAQLDRPSADGGAPPSTTSLEAVGDRVRAAVDDAVRSWEGSRGPVGTFVDVAPLSTMNIALDAVGRALSAGPVRAVAPPAGRLRRRGATRGAGGRAVVPLPTWTPTPTGSPAALGAPAAGRRLDGDRGGERRSRGSADGTIGDDLLGLMLDSGLGDDEIRDELVTMVIAGHRRRWRPELAWTLVMVAEATLRCKTGCAPSRGPSGPGAAGRPTGGVAVSRAVVDAGLAPPPARVGDLPALEEHRLEHDRRAQAPRRARWRSSARGSPTATPGSVARSRLAFPSERFRDGQPGAGVHPLRTGSTALHRP